MAVPFYIPEQNESGDASNTPNHYPNTTSSATQTPLPSPISREHLVQAFYDALYRCSINGSPDISENQSCNTPLFVFDQRDMLFQNNNINLINGIVNEELLQESPIIQQSQISSASSLMPICRDNIRCNPAIPRTEVDERFQYYMLEREKLEEFSGRLPVKKKRKEKLASKFISTENFFKWSTVVTAVVIAMGCGLLVTR